MSLKPGSSALPKYHWILREKDSAPNARSRRLSTSAGISELLARVLVARGIDSVDEAAAYLEPSAQTILPPESIPGLERARDRLLAAAFAKEQVLVHGDYDADGISGAVILHQTLKELGCKPRIFLPERALHGYGLAPQAVDLAKKAGINLIVSVDCGISSASTVARARAVGIEVIVTDHHAIPENPPRDAIIVHPDLEGDYPGGKIAGAMVAFKLAWSLVKASGGDVDGFLQRYLPLAALATVADVCDLTLENRAIVAAGLPGIPTSSIPGLRVLCKASRAGKENSNGEAPLTERDIAFGMAPILNAAGRMGNPFPAAKLLLAADEEAAWKSFRDLERLNRDRRRAQEEICFRLGQRPEVAWGDHRKGILALVVEGCPPGLAGLAASRLVETTGRPTCILVPGDDDTGPLFRGSMRGKEGDDLLELMSPLRSFAEAMGGHAGALGVTVRPDRIDQFLSSCGEIVWTAKPPNLELDLHLDGAPREPSAVIELDRTRPWGPGNPQPAFAWGPVTVKGTRSVGKKLEHVQVSMHDSTGMLCKGIGFNLAAEVSESVRAGSHVSAAGHFQINTWQGSESVEFQIKDLDPSLPTS